MRFCRSFGLRDGWWLRGQANYDTAIARATMGEALSRISRCLVKNIHRHIEHS
jgi:plasmid maintenance system antidote protein VapI